MTSLMKAPLLISHTQAAAAALPSHIWKTTSLPFPLEDVLSVITLSFHLTFNQAHSNYLWREIPKAAPLPLPSDEPPPTTVFPSLLAELL